MSKTIKPTQRIWDVVRALEQGYRLPSIQRSFVWEEDRIAKLGDSLMNDYPIGSLLVWRPPSALQIRTKRFTRDYRSGAHEISKDEVIRESTYLVLDGQQRLQSLYLMFFGSHDGKFMHFKSDSSPQEEQDNLRYQFSFLCSNAAAEDHHWMRPVELIDLKVEGGIILTKTDLIFATIVLRVPDLERRLRDLVDELNAGGQYDFYIDFLVKTSFVLFDKGAKYDVSKLKDDQYVKNLASRFDEFRSSLISTIEFLQSYARILSKRFLKSELALIPIIDFIFISPHQQIPEGQSLFLRQYLYMAFFMRFYSYGADGKPDFLHRALKENETAEIGGGRIAQYMSNRTNLPYEFTESMLSDLDIVLNIVQGGVTGIPRRRG